MSWRLARSLVTLRQQVTDAWPGSHNRPSGEVPLMDAGYLPMARRVARRLVANNPLLINDFDDLVQEAWIAACDHHHPADGLTYTIMKRRCVDWLRRQYGREGSPRQRAAWWTEPVGVDLVTTTHVEAQVVARETLSALARALRRLSPRTRDCVLALVTDGGQQAVAARWEMSESRVNQIRNQTVAPFR